MTDRRSFLKQLAGAAAFLSLPFPAFAGSCDTAVHTETRLMMGTFVSLSLYGVSSGHASEAMQAAFMEMARAEILLTRFDAASPLGHLNTSGRLLDVPRELAEVVHAARAIHRSSGGMFDPTVLPVVLARESGLSPHDPSFASARELVGMGRVRNEGSALCFDREGMQMSLDGIAKGYIADLGAKSLLRAGVQNFLINAGGDIVARGSKGGRPWRIGIQDPVHPAGGSIAACSLRDRAMATSGDYESSKRGFRHLVDPLNGDHPRPLSATVMAPTAMEADALATALCLMPDPMGFVERMPHTACCLVMPGGHVLCSSRWA